MEIDIPALLWSYVIRDNIVAGIGIPASNQ